MLVEFFSNRVISYFKQNKYKTFHTTLPSLVVGEGKSVFRTLSNIKNDAFFDNIAWIKAVKYLMLHG